MGKTINTDYLLDSFDMIEFFQGQGYVPEWVGGKTEYVLDICPFCGKEKHCGVSLSLKMVSCFRCHQSKNFFDTIKYITKLPFNDVVLMLQGKIDAKPFNISLSLSEFKETKVKELDLTANPISLPENYEFLGYKSVPQLKNRKSLLQITPHLVHTYKIGVCWHGRYRNRLIVCDINDNGEPIYWIARDITGKAQKKVLNPDEKTHGVGSAKIPFNFSLAKRYPTLIITEGVFDALYVGPNAIATYGSTIKKQHVTWMAGQGKFEKVILLYDADVCMEELQKQASIVASVFPTYICKLPVGDPDEYKKEELFKYLDSSVKYSGQVLQLPSLG